MFCNQCGKNIDDHEFCPYCGHGKAAKSHDIFTSKIWDSIPVESSGKSRFIAGILQIFLGSIGIGRFYLNDKKTGCFQILASVLTLGFGGFVWGVTDGFLILSGNVTHDGDGNPLDV